MIVQPRRAGWRHLLRGALHAETYAGCLLEVFIVASIARADIAVQSRAENDHSVISGGVTKAMCATAFLEGIA